jgi:hypothetical protein
MDKNYVMSRVRASQIHPIYHIEASLDTFYCVWFSKIIPTIELVGIVTQLYDVLRLN